MRGGEESKGERKKNISEGDREGRVRGRLRGKGERDREREGNEYDTR